MFCKLDCCNLLEADSHALKVISDNNHKFEARKRFYDDFIEYMCKNPTDANFERMNNAMSKGGQDEA